MVLLQQVFTYLDVFYSSTDSYYNVLALLPYQINKTDRAKIYRKVLFRKFNQFL